MSRDPLTTGRPDDDLAKALVLAIVLAFGAFVLACLVSWAAA